MLRTHSSDPLPFTAFSRVPSCLVSVSVATLTNASAPGLLTFPRHIEVPVMLPRSSRFHEQPSRRDSLHTRRKRPSAGPRHGPDERSQLNERGSPTPMDRRRSSLESWSNQSSVKFRESSLPLSSPTSAAEEVDGSLFTSLRSAVAEAAASRKSGRWSSPSSPIPSTSAACSRWESVNRDEEERAPIRTDKRALEEKEENVIIVTDVKAGYWYSVRQRFSWAIGGGDTVEEVRPADSHCAVVIGFLLSG